MKSKAKLSKYKEQFRVIAEEKEILENEISINKEKYDK